jgi:hypothetical protein
MVSPLRSRTGTMDFGRTGPLGPGRAARRWDSTASASAISRVNPYSVAMMSAEIPCGTK